VGTPEVPVTMKEKINFKTAPSGQNEELEVAVTR
jgi:hypothetical protein